MEKDEEYQIRKELDRLDVELGKIQAGINRVKRDKRAKTNPKAQTYLIQLNFEKKAVENNKKILLRKLGF